jgi:hypothetical protein
VKEEQRIIYLKQITGAELQRVKKQKEVKK